MTLSKQLDANLSDTLQIKSLQQAEYAEWLRLWQGYLTFYKTHLSEDISKATWEKIHNTAIPIRGFGAYKDDKLIGFAHVVLHPNTWNTTDCCYLEDLYVNSEVRGLGAGRGLIEYVYDFAKQQNCNRVYWTTQQDNHTARKLYEKVAKLTDMLQYRYNL